MHTFPNQLYVVLYFNELYKGTAEKHVISSNSLKCNQMPSVKWYENQMAYKLKLHFRDMSILYIKSGFRNNFRRLLRLQLVSLEQQKSQFFLNILAKQLKPIPTGSLKVHENL